jgi:hypothetical protein
MPERPTRSVVEGACCLASNNSPWRKPGRRHKGHRKQMREAATNLELENAARLRNEIKRLRSWDWIC